MSRAARWETQPERRRRHYSARFSLPTRVVLSVATLWPAWLVVRETTSIMATGSRDGAWALPLLALTALVAVTILVSLWRAGGR